ncbi:MAG: hypothetical protein JW882_21565 [Deltaproteobacteria bacterium]|nr:hypothetical protein [Deltaproteobacteria bacterium]
MKKKIKEGNFIPSPEYLAREKRVKDAFDLKIPDRIPILMYPGYLIAEMGGVTRKELYDNPDKSQEILEKIALQFQPDMITGLFDSPEPSRLLGDQMTRWPGYGLGPDDSFQFHEQEFMKDSDYDSFLLDPSDYAIRTYLPRAFSKMKGLSQLPPFGMSLFGFYNLRSLLALTDPSVVAALNALSAATREIVKKHARSARSMRRLAEIGFPGPFFLAGALLEAPFDFMADTLRGMRGIFLDMMRIPEKLLLAEEKVKNIMLEHAINMARTTGINYASFPLHRGSDGFMSLEHFEKFYWPQLRDMILQLVDAGLNIWVFYEGIWDQRLEYLAELPRGRTAGLFQDSDIFRVKDTLGDTMCIMGGMPIPLLMGGTVQEVRDHTQRLCEHVGKGGGYIMSTNIAELEGCKPELIRTWIDATKEFGVYI